MSVVTVSGVLFEHLLLCRDNYRVPIIAANRPVHQGISLSLSLQIVISEIPQDNVSYTSSSAIVTCVLRQVLNLFVIATTLSI